MLGAPRPGRLVSRQPPLAEDAAGIVTLEHIHDDIQPGDWGWLHTTGEGTSLTAAVQKTAAPFPGEEWRRLHRTDPAGRSRLAALRFRHRIMRRVREFFDTRGYLEVETPLRVPSPGVETHLSALSADDWFLSPSPEFQMKRLLAGGAGSIYQICRAFRRDETGARHNPEFTMLEWYAVGADTTQLRAEVEALITYVQEREDVPSPLPPPPYPRLPMAAAFARFAGVTDMMAPAPVLLAQAGLPVPGDLPDGGLSWEEAFFTVFVERIEPRLCEEGPVFLTQWPAPMASLARLIPENPLVADRFEFFAPAPGGGDLEIANGFGELLDGELQRSRSLEDLAWRRAHGAPEYPLDEKFLQALAEGMPPVSGIALGLDRLVMLWWGADHIRSVLTFAGDEL
ncbi:MAG: EF-P lysine aminoacylase GenX [Deltaproteobacteria bacterium HGW-Deltaproteobacteria-22]|nr:MAG: EF-P lysine aminoacylase GenX [Deltaproteobacteria bacterium HGW-Deltaproteobacteria-22]